MREHVIITNNGTPSDPIRWFRILRYGIQGIYIYIYGIYVAVFCSVGIHC